MLDLTRTRIYDSIEYPLASYGNQFEDGTALCGTLASGQMSATVFGSASASNIFLGFAYSTFTTPATNSSVNTYTVPSSAPYTITLPQTPVAASVLVYYNSNNASFTSETTTSGVTAAGTYNVTGAVVTFDSADAGATVTIVYTYNLTVIEALALVGTGVPGSVWPSNVTASIGVIQRGVVYTSIFDTSVNWNTQTSMVVGANGVITSASNVGAPVSGYVYEVPSVSSNFLGVYIHD
jgi:hypothetical protein